MSVDTRVKNTPSSLLAPLFVVVPLWGCAAEKGDTGDAVLTDPSGGLLTGGSTGASTGGATGASTGGPTGTGTGGTSTGASTGTGSATGGGNTTSVASGNDCVVPIPSSARIVERNGTYLASGAAEDIWACRNAVVSLTSGGHTVYADNADVVVNSTGSTIYLPTGAQISIFTGPNDYVIEAGYTLPTGTATVPIGNVTVCNTITYDLVTAPSTGC